MSVKYPRKSNLDGLTGANPFGIGGACPTKLYNTTQYIFRTTTHVHQLATFCATVMSSSLSSPSKIRKHRSCPDFSRDTDDGDSTTKRALASRLDVIHALRASPSQTTFVTAEEGRDEEEVDDGNSFDENQIGTSFISTSLLASFPIYRSSRSRSSPRAHESGLGANVGGSEREGQDHQATIRGRGRSMRRLSAEHSNQEVSRGRRRLPVFTSHYAYPQTQAQALDVYTHTSAAASLASL